MQVVNIAICYMSTESQQMSGELMNKIARETQWVSQRLKAKGWSIFKVENLQA